MKKVLIVEDDQWLAENYSLVFEKNGWQTRHVVLAEQAIEEIDNFQPNVLLLDFMLPEKNAPTLLNELQSHTDLAKLPVVICSSLNMLQYDVQNFENYGVRQILDKAKITPQSVLLALEKARVYEAN